MTAKQCTEICKLRRFSVALLAVKLQMRVQAGLSRMLLLPPALCAQVMCIYVTDFLLCPVEQHLILWCTEKVEVGVLHKSLNMYGYAGTCKCISGP